MLDDIFPTIVHLLIATTIFGYLLGSIPFGLLLTYAAGLDDVRKIGSGNIGATNVLRTGNKKLAVATLLLDALKGTFAVAIAARWGTDTSIAAGFGAFIGHLYPIWLGFKGGKGVAIYLGVLFGLSVFGAIAFAITWLLVAFVSCYSSLAAITAAIIAPITLYVMDMPKTAGLLAVMSFIVLIRHRVNISRLLSGTEYRIVSKR